MPKDQSKKGPKPQDADKELSQSFGIPPGPKKQIEVTLPKTLAVVLTARAFGQLFSYSEATDLEVSLLGIVERDKSLFTIREFHLVEQRGASSHTELEPSAVGELVERLIAEGRSDDAIHARVTDMESNRLWRQLDLSRPDKLKSHYRDRSRGGRRPEHRHAGQDGMQRHHRLPR